MTTRHRSSSAPAVLVALAIASSLLGACTPRTAYASLDNRTGVDVVVLDSWHEWSGDVAAGETDKVEVGIPGDCVDGLLVLTADLRRIAVVDGPVCEHDDVTVTEADLVAAGTVVLRNGTGLALSKGWLGGLPVDTLAVGEERVVPLAVPHDGCGDVRVRLITLDEAGDVVAEAEAPGLTLVCDGGMLVLEPWMASQIVAGEWVTAAPSPQTTLPATVTFTNGTTDYVVVDLEEGWLEVAPGEAAVAEFAASAGGCTEAEVRALIGPAGRPVPFFGTLCDGAHYVVGEQGFEAVTQAGEGVGDDG